MCCPFLDDAASCQLPLLQWRCLFFLFFCFSRSGCPGLPNDSWQLESLSLSTAEIMPKNQYFQSSTTKNGIFFHVLFVEFWSQETCSLVLAICTVLCRCCWSSSILGKCVEESSSSWMEKQYKGEVENTCEGRHSFLCTMGMNLWPNRYHCSITAQGESSPRHCQRLLWGSFTRFEEPLRILCFFPELLLKLGQTLQVSVSSQFSAKLAKGSLGKSIILDCVIPVYIIWSVLNIQSVRI